MKLLHDFTTELVKRQVRIVELCKNYKTSKNSNTIDDIICIALFNDTLEFFREKKGNQ